MLRIPPVFHIVLIHLLLLNPASAADTHPKTNVRRIQNVNFHNPKPKSPGILQGILGVVQEVIDYVDDKLPVLGFVTDFAKNSLQAISTGLDTELLGWTINDFFLMPKTKWCGYGDRAKSYEDLGEAADVDRCCRRHDLCFEQIPARKSKHNLTNNGLFTRSHCDCEDTFYNCLKNVRTHWDTAQSIGNTYFNILEPQCFRMDYPIMWCRSYAGRRCVSYKMNRREGRIYQWFDNKPFQ